MHAIESASKGAPVAIPIANPTAEIPAGGKQSANSSVPFECDDMAGFAVAKGTIQANQECIYVEYQLCDKLVGQFRSKIRTISIPWSRVVKVEFKKGFGFTGKLIIVGDSISVLQGFPNAGSGRIEVVIKSGNFELAKRLSDRIREIRPDVASNTPNLWVNSGDVNYSVTVMLLFFAILNAGLLAIAEVLCAYHLNGWVLSVCAILCAILLGPTIVSQIVMGVLYATTGNKTFANIGILTTMLPVSPLAPFGYPFGIWAYSKLGNVDQKVGSDFQEPSVKGWGATTLVFMRDSRNARIVSLLETLGCLVVFSLVGIYWFGVYPVTLKFRIVGDIEPTAPVVQEMIQRAIEARSPGANYQITFNSNGSFFLRCFQFQSKTAQEQLAV
jgi:hypothetical protein